MRVELTVVPRGESHMTLLLAAGNHDHVIVVADRRLTRDGALVDDESNKVCIFCCDDARVAVAFTGLAEEGMFRTQEWLFETLTAIGTQKHTFMEVLVSFQDCVTRDVAALAIEPSHRRLAFLIAGFGYWSAAPELICHHLSNFEAGDAVWGASFVLRTLDAAAHGVVLEASGAPGATKLESVRAMLKSSAPPAAVVRKCVSLIQQAARNKVSKGFIGEQCNSAVILAMLTVA